VLLLAADLPQAAAAAPALNVPTWFWIAFCLGAGVLLCLDMFVFHRHAHDPSLRESALWTLFWCGLALAFNAWIWWWGGSRHGLEFLIGYLVEWSLSMDNVFVFVVIFSFFGVPLRFQYRVLFWGIVGAILMRLTFVLAAGELLKRFEWILYLFGAFLIYTGVKLARSDGGDHQPDQNVVLRFARRYFRVAEGEHGEHFFVRQNGHWYVTTLFLVLLVIESTDLVFAVDSVPAIFGITKEPFIVFTSNIFAIMGLRALYFLLAGVMNMFRYLSYGLSAVLVFIGAKMLTHHWIDVPHLLSLAIIVGLLATAIGASLWAGWREHNAADRKPD
jgi:tellurite resistance protein TerC